MKKKLELIVKYMMSKLQNQINHVIIQDNKMMSNEKLQQLEEILKPIIN